MKNIILTAFLFVSITVYAQNEFSILTSIYGEKSGDDFTHVAALGDVNGDGFDDFLVAAPGTLNEYAKLYFGGSPFDTTNYLRLKPDHACFFGGALDAIAGCGDLNGDGYNDFVIGASGYGPYQSGKVFIYFGGKQIDTVADMTITSNGFYYAFGAAVSICGDLNNDGYDDLVISAPNDDYDGRGRVYIYFGGKNFDTKCDVYLEGKPYDNFGTSLAIVGDVNKDGFDDLLVGSFFALNGSGKANLFYGGDSIGFNKSVEFIEDTTIDGNFGRKVSALGDINGDGYNDFGVLSWSSAYIYSGKTLNKLANLKSDKLSWAPYDISNGYDFNKDGFSDFIIGYAEQEDEYKGSIALYFGSDMLDTIPAFILNGNFKNTYFGRELAVCGDINHDNYDEILIGELTNRGNVYIYSYGKISSVEKKGTIPNEIELFYNYPNPFNPTTVISYQISASLNPSQRGTLTRVTLKVYDILGKEIKTLVDKEQNAGIYNYSFDGNALASGVYLLRLTVQPVGISGKVYQKTLKMILQK